MPKLVLNGHTANDLQSKGKMQHKANLSMQKSDLQPSLIEIKDQTNFRQPPTAVAQILKGHQVQTANEPQD